MKGDLLNLPDAGVGLGVIVLPGTAARDEGLRQFAKLLVDRPGPTVLVWTADDVRALAEQHDTTSTLAVAAAAVAVAEPLLADRGRPPATFQTEGHPGKYAPSYRWVHAQDEAMLTLTFGEVEEVLGFPLPSSCRQHVPHWHSYDGSAVARAVVDAGWKASRVHLADEELTLVRAA